MIICETAQKYAKNAKSAYKTEKNIALLSLLNAFYGYFRFRFRYLKFEIRNRMQSVEKVVNCLSCHRKEPEVELKICLSCKSVGYCSRKCLDKDFKAHSRLCILASIKEFTFPILEEGK